MSVCVDWVWGSWFVSFGVVAKYSPIMRIKIELQFENVAIFRLARCFANPLSHIQLSMY